MPPLPFPIILASASPRRQELLRNAAIPFEVVVTNVDESPRPGESAADLCRRLAREKAEAAFQLIQGDPARADLPILAADTIVVLPGEGQAPDVILGKPTGPADAKRMLRALAGRTHRVMTGVCLSTLTPAPAGRRMQIAVETTTVYMSPITDAELDDYIAGGEPLDKAGAYAIQGRASRWIPRIEGCYFNVVGLPVARVFEMMKGLAVEPQVKIRN